MLREEEEEEIRSRRRNEAEQTLEKNYSRTFVKPVEKAANRRFAGKNGISKIKLVPLLNLISEINIYDENGNKINNTEIEEVIKKYYIRKKEANDSNSDRYFKERKPTNQKENLYNRSLGEESIFNY